MVAAGSGKRMGADKAKQYLLLDTIPILSYTLIRLSKIPQIDGILLVVPQDDCAQCRSEIVEAFNISKILDIVPGGKRRQDSVYNGLLALERYSPSIVFVHDGVRPFFTSATCSRVLEASSEYGAAVPGLPVVCTIKESNADNMVTRTIPRDTLWEIQTPQGFCYEKLCNAYTLVNEQALDVTDDAMVMEIAGEKVLIVEGNKENIKITRPVDLPVARQIMIDKEFTI